MAAPVAPPDAALPAAQDPGPNIIEAVQKQLGLKLELRTAPIPVLVVDHVEREPIGN
ncbi:MAG TPA: TIGR03435 family protein [Verrucomicrobiae bacterium]|nr:TIGR03435 family protein [Verrucomicrobiae bacterium]